VGKAFFASDNDHERVLRRRNNPTLLLTSIFSVNVGSTVVNLTISKPQLMPDHHSVALRLRACHA
jgi:hypothetical protein